MDTGLAIPENCENCGACCYLVVEAPAPADLPAELIAYRDGKAWMRREGGGRCAALDPQTRRCVVYPHRPPDCHNFDRGSMHCLVVRRVFFQGLRGKKLIRAYVKGVKEVH